MSDILNNNLEDAPASQPMDDICYNCTECSSMIEILSINKDDIHFKCIKNKHENIMTISEYLEKMKKYNDKNINIDKCINHNNNYESYCFECNSHLCKVCLKSREHIRHYKNYIMEINPTEEELDIIKKMIDENKESIKNLIDEREKTKRYQFLQNKVRNLKRRKI